MLVGSRAIEPSHDIQSSFLIPSIMDPHPALGTLSCFFSLESQSGVTFVGTGVVGTNYFYMGSRVIWLNKDKCWNIFTGNPWVPTNAMMTGGKCFLINYCFEYAATIKGEALFRSRQHGVSLPPPPTTLFNVKS